MFMMLVHVVHLPQLPQLYVSNIMACLQLGSTILKYVMLKMTLFVREVVERSGSDGLWMAVELDVWTVDLDDDFDLIEDRDEDGDDELMFDQGWSISEDCGSKDEDGDDGNNHYLLVDEELNIDKDGEMKEHNFQEFEPMSIMAITPQLFIGDRWTSTSYCSHLDWLRCRSTSYCSHLDRYPFHHSEDMAEEAPKSIYDFTVKDIRGNDVSLSDYNGKVLLIVNVASKCGLTHSNYKELNVLYEKYKSQGFEILAFPCNQFLGQEPGSNEDILEAACTMFKAEFPIFDKVEVNGKNTAPLYKFLKLQKGGLFGDGIKWNFTKFLVDKEGKVVGRYAPTTSPLKIEEDIQNLLGSA
ncbi:hypothetical protein AAG906_012492 [Vitis piasezkii]